MAKNCAKCGTPKQKASHRLTYTVYKTQAFVPDGRTAKVFFRTSMDIEQDGAVYSYYVSETHRLGYDLIQAILQVNPHILRFMIPTEEADFLATYPTMKHAV